MTEEWLKCQTQKMIVELNKYIFGSLTMTYTKNHVCLIQRASHEFLHNLGTHLSIILITTFDYSTFDYAK